MDKQRRALGALLVAVAWTAAIGRIARAEEPSFHFETRAAMPALQRPAASGRGIASLAARATLGDTTWVGHTLPVAPYCYGPWHIGTGPNSPGSGNPNGIWDWDTFASGESDSLQGWWPIRLSYLITGDLAIADTDRPWWAVDIGNQGNYVSNSHQQRRTFGVTGYWHVDGGSFQQYVVGFPGTATMTWQPISGNSSAWCGLRAHGDTHYQDPLTGNYFNQSVLEYNGINVGAGPATSKRFPGYASQWDQLLYRDVEIASGASLSLSFAYRTKMSTATDTRAGVRTGWFQYDPTTIGTVAVGGPNQNLSNFVSNTGAGQPADSFMVYIGVPADVTHAYTANGNFHSVYDTQRRWFSEVLDLGKPIRELLSKGGDNDATASFVLTAPELAPFYNSQQGATRYLRIVFRSKTNRGSDDLTGSIAGAYNSGGQGAALIDNVSISGSGLSGGAVGTSGFETPGEINNVPEQDNGQLAMGAWHSTAKPPGVYFHTHPLQGGAIGASNVYDGLVYNDVCGPPDASVRWCDMKGIVISAGNHDDGEKGSGPLSVATEYERMDGIISPTVNLCSNDVNDVNGVGLTLAQRNADEYLLSYDVYDGMFDLMFNGTAWSFGFQWYPAAQSNDVVGWGELRVPSYEYYGIGTRCFHDIETARENGLANSNSRLYWPDSVRVFLGKYQQCFRFGVSGAGCGLASGAYFDNVSLGFWNQPNQEAYVQPIGAPLWSWIQDAFPANDNPFLPGTFAFDTCAAHIKTGLNIAQQTGTTQRPDIPGDSTVIWAPNTAGGVDMMFRIAPGPGDYHTAGNRSSGLRPVPTDAANIAQPGNGDSGHPSYGPIGNFWGQYMAHPGPYASNNAVALHAAAPSGWDPNVWNSAKCDTAAINLFPVAGNPDVFDTPSYFGWGANWMATYHEDDAKYGILGIPRSRCFLIDPNGSATSTNITCSSVPGWAGPATGYNGDPMTKQATKIIPDGLLTPGSHVEYFFRNIDIDFIGSSVSFLPDTHFVYPQPKEYSLDGHRWQEFSVLPDRWKNPTYGGNGMACMLYVDLADRRGDERVWVSIADSIGATMAAKRGAHSGWRASGDQAYSSPDGGHNPFLDTPIDVSGDPSIAVYTHGGQPGSTWDMYGIRAGEQILEGSAGALGSRYSPAPVALAAGKGARIGPTLMMLAAYYQGLFVTTADLDEGLLGPFFNRGQNDVQMIEDFLSAPSSTRWVMFNGSGFARCESKAGGVHTTFLNNWLGTGTRNIGGPAYDYNTASGNFESYAQLLTRPPALGGSVFAVENGCITNGLLDPLANATLAVSAADYQNFGAAGPYVASVYTPVAGGKSYLSYVNGWQLGHLLSPGGANSRGRLGLYYELFAQLANYTGCSVQGSPLITMDVGGAGPVADFVGLLNNPAARGGPIVHLVLAASDHVQVKIYDLAGRRVRNLLDARLPAGERDLVWDGMEDGGQRARPGIYFTRVHYMSGRLSNVLKTTLLR